MYTAEGRYFSGHKTYWFSCPEKSGRVDHIEAAVKAYDNEGRHFDGPRVALTPDQVQRAIVSTQGQVEVVNELIRETYERGCALEDLKDERSEEAGAEASASASATSAAEQVSGDVAAPEVEGLGDIVEDR